MMESYESFADYNDVMSMVEELVSGVATQITGSPVVEYGERTIDFTPPWPRLGFREEVIKYSGIDFLDYPDTEDLKGAMRDVGVDVSQQVSRGGLLDKLISAKVEQHLVQPTFLIDFPIEMSPLSKKKAGSSSLVERFEGYAAGMEFCNAFTELNDPVDQRQRFEEQEDVRAEFEGEETDRLDEDFLVAIEHGMPPTGGLGLGIDRLTMLLSGRQNLREVVLFPQLRSR
jgi:lysyl-tRNA synthetase class 2